ncbi:hypothetical protein R3P38DRAFT_3170297 [Favolaschia claudopus]|uniref:RNase III domain-containing protein n=1 Tax=Favolaschia claudopus TaxID=2862362 RepID=A0AAW0DV41_9AGAR
MSSSRPTKKARLSTSLDQILIQNEINRIVRDTPGPFDRPVLSPDVWDQYKETNDPRFLRCLEWLGDADVALIVFEIQDSLFPNQSVGMARLIRRSLVSNKTLKHICWRLGVRFSTLVDVEDLGKAPGDAFEILFALLRLSRNRKTAAIWISDIFRPIIQALGENPLPALMPAPRNIKYIRARRDKGKY